MNNSQTSADDGAARRKAYSVNVQTKARSTNGCAFCWFVLSLYPTMTGMTENDTATYKMHLVRSHGLKGDIPA